MPTPNANLSDITLLNREDVEIEKSPLEKAETRPAYQERPDLNEEQKKRLTDEVFLAFETLKTDRGKIEGEWDDLEAQYEGEMQDTSESEFNLNVPVTKTKINALVRMAIKSFLKSDPKFSALPRPQSTLEGFEQVAEAQEDYLDYLIDEQIDLSGPLRKVLLQASVLDVGLAKLIYELKMKRQKRKEFYSAEQTQDPAGSGMAIIPGLKDFLSKYPDAINPSHKDNWVVRDLQEGKDVSFVASFNECVYDNPRLHFVNIRNFWVDKDTEGYEGLCNARITIERMPFTFQELKAKEHAGEFENVDQMKYRPNDKDAKDNSPAQEEIANWSTKKHDVIEVVYTFNLEKGSYDPEDEVRLCCWFGEESEALIGYSYFPYFYLESYYIPFYSIDRKAGFYKRGVARDLTDSHLAQNAMLNFILTAAWINNTVTPIVRKGSEVAIQLDDNSFIHGKPILVSENASNISQEVSFLDKPPVDYGSLINILLLMSRYDDDSTGISSLATGKEAPLDPRAPAAKTAMLLQQSGIAIEDYIDCLLPSFSQIGQNILALVYQMSKGPRKYRQRQRENAVVGSNPFSDITPDQMSARTNIQSQASSFVFDEIKNKQQNLALYQLLRSDPMVARNPKAVYALASTLIKSWSPMWKNKKSEIIPTPEQFSQQQVQTAVQGLQAYMGQLQQKREVTGLDPEVNMKDFMSLFEQLQTASVNNVGDKGEIIPQGA